MRLIKLSIVVLLFSCKKEKPLEPVIAELLNSGMAVLCEGLYQQNNSSVTWVNFNQNSVSNNLFEAKANRQLGDTGNDIQRYGGKIYIVVSLSSTVEVLNASNFNPIKQIVMEQGGNSKQPRSIVFNGSKAYVTCFDGFVDVIDTASLTVVNRIAVGLNPEDLAISNGKLYVTNSGGLSGPTMDSTVSVINLSSETEILKITVGLNPGDIIKDDEGDLYVISSGDYGAIPAKLVRIDAVTDQMANTYNIQASSLCKMNGKFLIANYNYATLQNTVSLFNPVTDLIENAAYLNVSGITTLYGIQFDAFTNKIYVMDAMGFTNTGYVRVFEANGTYINSYHVGLNPTKAIFYD